MCRNTFNNRLSAYKNNTIRNINNVLKKNRRILECLCPAQKSRVRRKTMQGFNFQYFTHLREKPAGTWYFVYDIGYRELENDHILIIRNADRM